MTDRTDTELLDLLAERGFSLMGIWAGRPKMHETLEGPAFYWRIHGRKPGTEWKGKTIRDAINAMLDDVPWRHSEKEATMSPEERAEYDANLEPYARMMVETKRKMMAEMLHDYKTETGRNMPSEVVETVFGLPTETPE